MKILRKIKEVFEYISEAFEDYFVDCNSNEEGLFIKKI